jgi:hypothetical protein
VFLLDTAGEVPVDVEVQPLEHAVDVRFATTDAGLLPQVGAVPKAVSLNEVTLARSAAGWAVLGDARRLTGDERDAAGSGPAGDRHPGEDEHGLDAYVGVLGRVDSREVASPGEAHSPGSPVPPPDASARRDRDLDAGQLGMHGQVQAGGAVVHPVRSPADLRAGHHQVEVHMPYRRREVRQSQLPGRDGPPDLG